VVAAGIYLRGLVEPGKLRAAIVAGLAAPIAFWLWLMTVVPRSTAIENFIRYPMTHYPKVSCRGLPTRWGDSFSALFAPLDKLYWPSADLVLIFGNLLAPILGVLLLAQVARSWRGRTASGVILLCVGIMDLILFVEMRPRQGGAAEPAVPFALISLALLSQLLRASRPRLTAWACASVGFVLVIAISVTLPSSFRSWTGWPDYDPVLGFTSGTPDYGYYKPSVIDPIAATVHRFAGPGEPIFVALQNNQGHFANAPALYWILDRPPASRFIEFDPCLTDRNDIQQEMIRDLRKTNVVVQSTFFPGKPFQAAPSVLDHYLASEFVVVSESRLPGSPNGDGYFVLVRRDRLSSRPHD
jgi:hypothetical protein